MVEHKTNLLINCDMGEWDAPHLTPVDEKIMPFVDMSNIACGGHAGSKKIIASTIEIASRYKVNIGAHPGFEDRENFGRKYLSLKRFELENSLKKQLTDFLEVCEKQNVKPFHIKAHGALYHACNKRELEAEVLIDVMKELCPDIIILVAPQSLLEIKAGKEGISTMTESFIDRRYNDDGSLVSRSEPEAVILDTKIAKGQFDLLLSGKVVTKSGVTLAIKTETACIHGDNPNCLQILQAISHA